ncbi:glycosyltransferase family 4 protein [Rhizobium sp. CC-YZS058]|uniref:glycosyltransferase family 4 protein n=1 Tax=Rhizobium sp. CC-YZS058 TaxID=3042153 RepID=UPI002B05EED5|nr:glycosyltransferase family 4 protein [Rhizobium sp. CC-YZS058]MEA3535453.1 glycosyltransferase family 4 protein [Rhizobium sp. CC-YZS058]
MRILHVTSLFAPDRVGGAELFVENLVSQQRILGHEVAVAAVTRRVEPPRRQGDATLYSLGHDTPFFVLDWPNQPGWKQKLYKIAVQRKGAVVGRLEAAIRDFRPDVVNTHSLSELTPTIWPMIARCGVPVVHTLHDFTSMCSNGSLFHDGHICDGSSIKCRLMTKYHRRQQRTVKAAVGVGSDILERHVRAGFFADVPVQNRKVIWNAIDAPTEARKRQPPPLGEPVVFGYLGRLEAPKGADVLLEALGLLPAEGWSLIMAGKAPDGLDQYRRKAAHHPVTFPGYVDADQFFEQIDCLVVPPLWPEAFGRTVTEALLRGIPVIGSDLAGVAEQIAASGAGFVFEPGNVMELAAAMRSVMDDRTRLLQAVNRQSAIAARVDPDRVAADYLDLYTSLAAGSRADVRMDS